MFLYYNWLLLQTQGKKNTGMGQGDWHKLLAIFNPQIRFCFWWKPDPTMWGSVGRFHRASFISTRWGGGVGGGGGDLSTRHSFICGALPGSQTTYPFIYHFWPKWYHSPPRIPSTNKWFLFHIPSFFFWTFSQPGFLPVFSKFSNTHSLCRDYPAFTPSSMRKSSISAHFVKEVYKRVLCCFFLGQWWILTHLIRGVFRNISKSKSSTSHASHARKNERGLQIVFLYVTKEAFSYFLARF